LGRQLLHHGARCLGLVRRVGQSLGGGHSGREYIQGDGGRKASQPGENEMSNTVQRT
jgi:hypothetical protein